MLNKRYIKKVHFDNMFFPCTLDIIICLKCYIALHGNKSTLTDLPENVNR